MLLALFCFCPAVAAPRTFTVGFDANFPPYGYVKNGEYKGFDLDLAREVARRNGWQIKLKAINWDAKDGELNSGMIDCIWNGFTINGRENNYTWSDPYVINEQVVMVKSGSPVKKLTDLKGKKVAVQTDTPVQKALSPGGECYALGQTFAGLIVVPDYNNAVMQLESGSVDAIALDIGVAKTKLKTGDFRLLNEIVMKEMYGIGFRKGDTALRDAVQNTLLDMAKDGTSAKISAEYFDGKNIMVLGKLKSVQKNNGQNDNVLSSESVLSFSQSFTVGFDANFPPYGYVKNGEYKGFDLDLAREVARRNGWQIKLKAINWDAKDSELNSGMIDCIWNGFTINGRENNYTWSDPYVINEQVVMVKSGSPVKKLTDLKGKKVAVQTDTPVQKALSPGGECYALGQTFAGLIVVPDYNNAVMQLESGSVDAIALDIGVAKTKLKTGNFRLLNEIVMKEMYGIGFRKGDTALRDAVQNTLLDMVSDGTAARISAEYFDGKNVMALGNLKHVKKDNDKSGDKLAFYSVLKELGKGLLVSMAIFVLTLVFALPLGLLVAVGRMSRNFLLRNVFRIFISIMRGTPLMLQLLVWFFGPYYLLGIQLSKLSFCGLDYRFIAVIIGFSLNYAAYFAEIYRAGIESIPKGQYEAAGVLGYSSCQTFFRIILPQVIKRILPPVTNEVITLVKDTSLAFSLAVLEMFTIAKQIASASSSMMPFIVAGVFYYVFNFIVAGVMALIEKKLNYYR